MDDEGLAHLLGRVQDGVVARRQLVALGACPHDVRRMLRSRTLNVVHPGVYVDHTGPLAWQQRAWAAVLAHWPAALTRESALPSPPSRTPIQVAIDDRRSTRAVPGVVAHRTAGLAERVQWTRSPPRVRIEHAAIDVASSRGDVVERFRVLADVVQTRQTDAARIAGVLRTRRGVAHGAQLRDLLGDLELGACSVLEREFLLLERRHGLHSKLRTRRQAPGLARGGRVFRDVELDGLGVVIELDGRAFHDSAAARDADARRDLETIAAGDTLTVRLTYALVVRDGCRTMRHLAVLLHRRGWRGQIAPCPDCAAAPVTVDARSGATR